MLSRRALFTIMLFLSIIAFPACTPGTISEPVTPPTRQGTPVVLADCFVGATAVAWLDENGDGVWDNAEPPLPGIDFVLEPSAYSRTTTDKNGVADILAITPIGADEACPTPVSVQAVVYTGYTPTTPSKIDYHGVDGAYQFGFQPISELTPTAATATPPALPEPVLIETETVSGIIFTADMTAAELAWLDEPADGSWMPTVEEVMGLEAGLADYLQAEDVLVWPVGKPPLWERLPDYTRQYFGLMQEGKRLIYGNYFCDPFNSPWQEMPVVVADGGDCYFQVVYNVDTQIFMQLTVNGEA